uniref:Tetraspanin 1 n=1 Tax=Bubo bubo TaxID=30461 RepID=A0A8C0EQP8_BUBBB
FPNPRSLPAWELTLSFSSQLGGGTLLGVGIWVTVDGKSFLDIFGALSSSVLQVVNVSYFLIVIGAILLAIGFLGCCGAQKESKCLLMMFFSVVLIIFIAEIAAAVVALVYTGLVSGISKSWVGLMWDLLYPLGKQETLGLVHCCGLNNYTDFTDSYWLEEHRTYPAPCCKNMEPCNITIAAQSNVPVWTHQRLFPSGRAWFGVCPGMGREICPVAPAPALDMVVPWALCPARCCGGLGLSLVETSKAAAIALVLKGALQQGACLELSTNPGTMLPF